MLDDEFFATALELKSSPDAAGEFTGYGAVFGNVDLNGDVIMPGAFRDTIAERKGRALPMHFNHGIPELGGRRGVGSWHAVSEDSTGVEVKGRLAGMNTETGRYLFEQVREGAVPGLSIGFKVASGGATFGTKAASGARRTLTKLHLSEISLVDDPCNTLALIREVKSRVEGKAISSPTAATTAIAAAIKLHQAALKGGDAPTAEERAKLLQHLQDAHEAMTGSPLSLKTAALPTVDPDAAAASLAAAMRLHDKSMGSEYSYASPKDKALMMDHLRDAHGALTGQRAPDGLEGWTKSAKDEFLDEIKSLISGLVVAPPPKLLTAADLGFG